MDPDDYSAVVELNNSIYKINTFENNKSTVETFNIPDYVTVSSLVTCLFVLAVGALGNALIILVILTNKLLRSSTNLFLLNLSVADLLFLAVCTPTMLVEVSAKSDAWIAGKIMCYVVPFVELAVSHTSVLTILAITVERYYAICLPLQAGIVCTKTKATLTCVISWAFGFLVTLPILIWTDFTPGVEEDQPDVCITDASTVMAKTYFIFIIVLFFLVPLLILVVMYRLIAAHLVPSKSAKTAHQQDAGGGAGGGSPKQNQDHRGGGTERVVVAESTAVIRSRRQVVVMLIAVVFFFFACLLPFKLITLFCVVSPIEPTKLLPPHVWVYILYFSRVMYYINSAVNPILYNVMSSKFRDGFKRALWRCCGRHFYGGANNPYGNSTYYQSSLYYGHTGATTATTTAEEADNRKASFMSRVFSNNAAGNVNRRAVNRTVSHHRPATPSTHSNCEMTKNRLFPKLSVPAGSTCSSPSSRPGSARSSSIHWRDQQLTVNKNGSVVTRTVSANVIPESKDGGGDVEIKDCQKRLSWNTKDVVEGKKAKGSPNFVFIEERRILVLPAAQGQEQEVDDDEKHHQVSKDEMDKVDEIKEG